MNTVDSTTQDEFDLRGLNVQQAQQYIFQYATALNLDRKKVDELQEELIRWKKRVQIAHGAGDQSLAAQAENKVRETESSLNVLRAEITHLSNGVEKMKHDVVGIDAKERSIDPDLLEQELRIATGSDMSADDSAAQTEKKTEALLKNAEADSALTALKAKMGLQ